MEFKAWYEKCVQNKNAVYVSDMILSKHSMETKETLRPPTCRLASGSKSRRIIRSHGRIGTVSL